MENTNEYKGLNVGDITVMKNITYMDVDAIRQIANFHTEMLQDDPMAQKGKTAMMCALYEEMIQRRLKYEQEYICVVSEQTQIHAYIWGHFDAPSKTVTIESLYVSEEYRHKGIATTLKRNVEKWAKSLRAQQVIGTVLASNTAMLTLNEKLGYRVQKVIMQKELNSD